MAFSFGFITGPVIGAYFASQSQAGHLNSFAQPAQLAMFFQLLSIFLVILLLDETLSNTEVNVFFSFNNNHNTLLEVNRWSF